MMEEKVNANEKVSIEVTDEGKDQGQTNEQVNIDIPVSEKVKAIENTKIEKK